MTSSMMPRAKSSMEMFDDAEMIADLIGNLVETTSSSIVLSPSTSW